MGRYTYRDICGSSSWRVRRLDGFRLNTLATFDQNDSETVIRLAANSEARQRVRTSLNGGWRINLLVRERSVGDPLLSTVDDPVLAVLSFPCCGFESLDIATSERLGDGQ